MQKSILLFTANFMCVVAQSASIPLITDGLVGFYSLEGNGNDASGHGRHGTVQNFVSVPDKEGNPNAAGGFGSSNNRVFVEDPNEFTFGSSEGFTITAWIQEVGVQINTYVVGKYDNLNNGYGLGTDLQGDGYAFVKHSDNSIVQTRGDLHIADGNWHHLAMSYANDGTLSLYVDGLLDEVQFSPIYFDSDNSLRFTIGGIETGENFNGKIDDVYVFDRAISEFEIKVLAGLEPPKVPDYENSLVLFGIAITGLMIGGASFEIDPICLNSQGSNSNFRD